MTSDIPTIDATPTDGSANAVSSNGVFDALATKVSKSDYTPSHSILVQQSGTGSPTALQVGNNTLVGRVSGGGSDIDDLSTSQVRNMLSINNVDNTSDANKPVSTATQTALNGKQRTLKDFDTKEGFYLFEDFIGNPANSNFNSFGVSTAVSGAGASCLPNTTYPNRTNQQGVIQLSAGTTTTGFSIIRIGDTNAGSHYLGNGVYTMQFFANIETLSDATNRFYNFFGATATNNVLSTNIIAFIYDEGGASANIGAASPNWKCVTRLTSTSTVTTTTVPIVAGEWFVLKIVVNANASSVEFFINNVSVATHTTNIPTLITPRIAHIKTAGTTNRNIFADYMLIEQIYTTPRTI